MSYLRMTLFTDSDRWKRKRTERCPYKSILLRTHGLVRQKSLGCLPLYNCIVTPRGFVPVISHQSVRYLGPAAVLCLVDCYKGKKENEERSDIFPMRRRFKCWDFFIGLVMRVWYYDQIAKSCRELRIYYIEEIVCCVISCPLIWFWFSAAFLVCTYLTRSVKERKGRQEWGSNTVQTKVWYCRLRGSRNRDSH